MREKREREEEEKKERIRLDAEERERRAEDARRMMEEARREEEEREQKEREEEEKKRREEEEEEEKNRQKRELLEQKAKEEGERLKKERELAAQKKEEERLARKKRLEMIMRRTRGGESPTPTPPTTEDSSPSTSSGHTPAITPDHSMSPCTNDTSTGEDRVPRFTKHAEPSDADIEIINLPETNSPVTNGTHPEETPHEPTEAFNEGLLGDSRAGCFNQSRDEFNSFEETLSAH
uniref:ensconsin-like n=1 Tax=Ciona intestinalis TaxID=7719 RepID=UPI0005214B6B|nr:ensconsin-like [Ciona intestinalis]|eukprot:XP_026693891.1 ensconsin-like [Ciona intestinalis]